MNKNVIYVPCIIYLYIKRANVQTIILYSAFGLFNPHCLSSFLGGGGAVCVFLSFPLNIYYYMYIYSYTDLTNSYNIFTIILQPALFIGLFFFFLHSTPFLLVLFSSFLLNIYMCIHNYTNTTYSYNIFTIIKVLIF